MSDDLVKRHREECEFKFAPLDVCDCVEKNMSDRIEELEAKLAKAVEALDDFIRLDDDYSPFGGELLQDRVERTWRNARTALAELKGQDR